MLAVWPSLLLPSEACAVLRRTARLLSCHGSTLILAVPQKARCLSAMPTVAMSDSWRKSGHDLFFTCPWCQSLSLRQEHHTTLNAARLQTARLMHGFSCQGTYQTLTPLPMFATLPASS